MRTLIKNKLSEYSFDGVIYRKAVNNDNDNANIKYILNQTPMQSWIMLSTKYEPNYFNSKYLFGEKETILASKDNKTNTIVGMCSYIRMPVYLDGKITIVVYLGELRVLPEFRNKLYILRNGYKSIQLFCNERSEITNIYTCIAKENIVARRILEANLKDMPVYHPLGEMVTLAIPARKHKLNARFQQAQSCDIPELVKFYNRQARKYEYSPVLTAVWLNNLDGKNGLRIQDFYLLKNGPSIRACFALWDQRNIKQTVVCGYRFPLNITRKAYNIFARLFGRVVLPKIGEHINYIFISFIALDESIKGEFREIINEALMLVRSRGATLALLGMAEENTLFDELNSFPKQTYRTCIEKVTWQDQATVDNITNHSNSRIVQPEIAIL